MLTVRVSLADNGKIEGNVEIGGALWSLPSEPLVIEELADGTRVTIIYQELHSTALKLRAIPEPGYYFVRWKGEIADETERTNNTVTIEMTCPKQITAVFAPILYKVQVSTEPVDGGKVIFTPMQPSDGYPAGIEITIMASPIKGYEFSGWTGDNNGQDNALTIIVDKDMEITANFVQKKSMPLSQWFRNVGIGAGIIIIIGLTFLLIRFVINLKKLPRT